MTSWNMAPFSAYCLKRAVLFGALTLFSSLADPLAHQLAPPVFPELVMTEGIVGGIVAPHRKQQLIFKPQNNRYQVYLRRQPQFRGPITYYQGLLSKQQSLLLVQTITRAKLFTLPREVPTGSQDIYKQNVSILIRQGGASWRNGAPSGCRHGFSRVQATPGQIRRFVMVVQRAKKLLKKMEIKPISKDAYQRALSTSSQ